MPRKSLTPATMLGVLPSRHDRVEAQETQFRIVLTAFKPGRDKAVPEPIDYSAIVVDTQLSVDGRKQAMTFRGIDQYPLTALGTAFGWIGFLECEEVNRFPIAVELRRHRLWRNLAGADHRSHVGFDRVPEPIGKFVVGGMDDLLFDQSQQSSHATETCPVQT